MALATQFLAVDLIRKRFDINASVQAGQLDLGLMIENNRPVELVIAFPQGDVRGVGALETVHFAEGSDRSSFGESEWLGWVFEGKRLHGSG